MAGNPQQVRKEMLRFGYDSREAHAIAHYQRALDGARGLDMALYREELARMDGDRAADGWPRS